MLLDRILQLILARVLDKICIGLIHSIVDKTKFVTHFIVINNSKVSPRIFFSYFFGTCHDRGWEDGASGGIILRVIKLLLVMWKTNTDHKFQLNVLQVLDVAYSLNVINNSFNWRLAMTCKGWQDGSHSRTTRVRRYKHFHIFYPHHFLKCKSWRNNKFSLNSTSDLSDIPNSKKICPRNESRFSSRISSIFDALISWKHVIGILLSHD